MTLLYRVLLKREGGSDGTYLPINPEALEISVGAKNESFFLLNQGETVNPGRAFCRSIAFSSLLPSAAAPYDVVAQWEQYIKDRTVLRLIIVGDEPWGQPRFELNVAVILEKIKYTEKGGEPGVLFFDMELKEYRFFSLRVIS